ncbi:MAG TPA: DUF4442 domain-containing protein [Nevskiaceae bacterium]|nr:DUF4442 domain-containing protein [Nevskiaceae bacterium]
MAAATNSLNRAVGWFSHAPLPLRQRLVTALFTHAVHFAGTAGVRFEGLTAESATVALANRRRVQNHIHGVHAAATALLAETATGAVFAFNLPNGRLPLLKSLHVDYLRRATGSLRAVATLPAVDRQRMQSDERGETHVPVIITDAAGEQPVACELVWAWVPKH